MQQAYTALKCRLTLLLVGTCFLSAFPSTASAEAPPVGSQVPGYYRMQLGRFEITALCDGLLAIDKAVLRGATPDEIDRLLARQFLGGPKMPTSVNAYLVNTSTQLVLIDTGAGSTFGSTLGRLAANLRAAGYRPEQVDTVVITHLHGDHAGGLLDAEGRRAFPKATVYVPKADHDFWVKKAEPKSGEAAQRRTANLPSRIAAPYLAAGRWKTYEPGHEPVPGIRAVDASGHTPGHSAIEVRDGAQRLFVWGDSLHCMAVQLPRPEVAVRYDANQAQAIAARKRLLAQLAEQRTRIAGAHMPFPGIGRVRADGPDAYTWVPVLFEP